MNNSIYLMVSVPYLALGVVSFLIIRGVRKNRAYLAALAESNPAPEAKITPG